MQKVLTFVIISTVVYLICTTSLVFWYTRHNTTGVGCKGILRYLHENSTGECLTKSLTFEEKIYNSVCSYGGLITGGLVSLFFLI